MFSRIILITIGFIFIVRARGNCSIGQQVYAINETDPAGTVIMNISKSTANNVTCVVVDKSNLRNLSFENELNSCLSVTNHGTWFTLENTKPLDLEYFKEKYNKVITAVTVKITCDIAEIETRIIVIPVNEYPPVFQDTPFNVSIQESTPIGNVVFKLKPHVTDKDVGASGNMLFMIHPHSNKTLDGKDKFAIKAITRGDITLNQTLDFDIPNSPNQYLLNVSVADEPGTHGISFTTYTDVSIQVTDVDDQAPHFSFPNCAKPCLAPSFESTVTLKYSGDLKILPHALRAIDDDTLGTSLMYSFKQGNQKDMFKINPNTGNITVTNSVESLNLPDDVFRLVIEVRKDLPDVDLSSIAILSVYVWERRSNGSGIPEPPVGRSKETSDSGSSLLIPLIVVGVILLIIIIAFIIVLIKYRKLMAVTPVEEKSEPQTEDEALTSDGDENNAKVDQNKRPTFVQTTNHVNPVHFPDTDKVKANQLPPLAKGENTFDTVQENTSTKNKKKRKRDRTLKKILTTDDQNTLEGEQNVKTLDGMNGLDSEQTTNEILAVQSQHTHSLTDDQNQKMLDKRIDSEEINASNDNLADTESF